MPSSAAATCTSAWVSTPPVMARACTRVSTMVTVIPFSVQGLRDGTRPLAAGAVNPGLFPGQADQVGTAGGCHRPGPGRQIVSQDSPSGVSRFGGQAGTQAPDPTPVPHQDRGSRAGAGSTTHILPADSALTALCWWVKMAECRLPCYAAPLVLGAGRCGRACQALRTGPLAGCGLRQRRPQSR